MAQQDPEAARKRRAKLKLTLWLCLFGGVAAATSTFARTVGDVIGWSILILLGCAVLGAGFAWIVGEAELSHECTRPLPPMSNRTPRYHPRHDHRPVPDDD